MFNDLNIMYRYNIKTDSYMYRDFIKNANHMSAI